ncbi:Metacaspase-1B [Diplonema papillatum]|nr:Metacaspase-1B [Diplonema papillatum]
MSARGDPQKEMSSDPVSAKPSAAGPGGPSRGGPSRRQSSASQSAPPAAPAGPTQPDRPQRKSSKSGDSTGLPDSAPASIQRQPGRKRSLAAPTSGFTNVPQVPLQAMPQLSSYPLPVESLRTRGPYGPAMAANEIIPPRAPGPQARTSNVQRYQTNLANHIDVNALVSLQADTDPLLEALDPFLGKRVIDRYASTPGNYSGYNAGPSSAGLTQADLSRLDGEQLRRLVGQPGGGGDPFQYRSPEKVDISPPRTPPGERPGGRSDWGAPQQAPRNLDPAAIVAEVENRELVKAAQAMLDENLSGAEIRRNAVGQFYANAQDLGMNDFMAAYNDFVGDSRMDPVRMAQMQRAAKVDPFIRDTRLGIPNTVDWTRMPAPGSPAGDGMRIVRDLRDEPEDDLFETGEPAGPVQEISPEPIYGASRALLIGVGYTDSMYEMPDGPKNVLKMKSYLTEQGFFGKFLCLSDETTAPDKQPTYANIQTALSWLVEDALPGNSLFLYICGRAQVRADSPDSTDILPSDFEAAGAMADFAINDILLPMVPSGAKLTIVSDLYPCGQMLDLPYTMVSNHDGSFRMIEGGSRATCSGTVVHIFGKREDVSGEEPPMDLTQCFMDFTKKYPRASFKDLLIGLRRLLQQRSDISTLPCISTSTIVDFKQTYFHLGAPQSLAEEDPRLCDAKYRTKHLRSELGMAEEDLKSAEEDRRTRMTENMRQRAEEQDRKRREGIRERAFTEMIQQTEYERIRRNKLLDDEATTRHNIIFQKHSEESGLLNSAILGQSWNRLASAKNTGLPVVVGVKWHRADERKGPDTTIGKASDQPGTVTRVFDVVRRSARPGSPTAAVDNALNYNPAGRLAPPTWLDQYLPSHMQPRTGTTDASLVTPSHGHTTAPVAAVQWKRVPDEHGIPQWIREELPGGGSPSHSPVFQ